MLFDKGVLKHECFHFIAHLNPFNRVRGSDHVGCARMQLRHILKITRQARTKICGLADIDDSSEFIFELIRTWRGRNSSGRWSLYSHDYFLVFALDLTVLVAAGFFVADFFAAAGFFTAAFGAAFFVLFAEDVSAVDCFTPSSGPKNKPV